MPSTVRTRLILAAAVALVLIVATAAIVAFGATRQASAPPETENTAEGSPDLSADLREAVSPDGILEHVRRFAAIAEANGGNRAAGTPGYEASAEYVARTLRQAGYDVQIQRFDIPASEQAVASELAPVGSGREGYTRGDDFSVMEHSGAGEVEAPVQPVDFAVPPEDAAPTSGCEIEDFEGFERGSVALLRRGTCEFAVKVANAQRAGAGAVLISNTGGGGERAAFRGSLGRSGEATPAEIPVLATSSRVGEELAGSSGAQTRVLVRGADGPRTTGNIVATSPGGDDEHTVMVGAHLDSVPEGPGINDNASGSATVLEIAQELAELDAEPRNRVRFAFWGGEELGLLGSKHYVNELDESQVDDIAVYLNFDMVGSPNYVPFVYGSPEVTSVLEAFFDSRDLETASIDLAGRSDHGPFAAEGVPVGGLFSGDSTPKTDDQAEAYGGEAGVPYDRCYHRACDDRDNLSREALNRISDAAAHATATFASRER